ncbi:HlyD family type I secretion periplasmic adaptor subunit [Duganella sp. FT94W]|uniref:Membrane fusion protein (MFP) family protein n=1 Tax=Duganella lactea TaxID=2692173 RepID=A0ABW9VD91_9BURK|nr:HlyD family type I secretion periplasmic adaptor subunit [Duganella lactea]MYM37526.1 HlyD family type I secretion periplasmic adaptor subunit [Duganella lactea]
MSMAHRWQAMCLLLQRYRDTARFHWQARQRGDETMFNAREAEFLPASLALQETPVSPSARLLARLMVAMVLVLLAWAYFGQIDIVVNAMGQIVPGARTKLIAAVEVASVKAVHVEEGQAVRRGDVLVELDASAFDAERDKAVGDRGMYVLQAARSQALMAAIDAMRKPLLPPVPGIGAAQHLAAQQYLEGQYLDFAAKVKKADDDVQRCTQALPLARKQVDDYRELTQSHDVPYHAYLEKEQTLIDLEGQLAAARNQRGALIAEGRRTALDALTEANRLAAGLTQDALRAASQSRLQVLRAPVDGTVQQLTVHTVGGVVPAAQPLMSVVPTDAQVEIEAVLENKDMGFVREGQTAEVKVDAYEYTKYGTIPAHVVHLSHDAVADEKKNMTYLARVVLDRAWVLVDGQRQPLAPGMTVSVEIKTGSRRVVEYVLSPLLQHGRESFNER